MANKNSVAKLSSVYELSKQSIDRLWKNKNLFSIILLFYVVAYIIAVQTNVTNSSAAGVYQAILFISLSLVILWTIKKLETGKKVTASDAFYKSAGPLIPFFLILMLISIELLPLVITLALFNALIVGGTAVLAIEKVIWIVFFLLLSVASLYWLSATVFSLYFVTLDEMTPVQAIKEANKMVKKRRIIVFGRFIFLPITLAILIYILLLPFTLLVHALITWVLFVLVIIGVAVSHSYMYNLFQEVKSWTR